jgi:hypothetical protein
MGRWFGAYITDGRQLGQVVALDDEEGLIAEDCNCPSDDPTYFYIRDQRLENACGAWHIVREGDLGEDVEVRDDERRRLGRPTPPNTSLTS